MSFQQVAELLGGQTVDTDGLRLQLADLAHGLAHSLDEPLPLGLHLAGGNVIVDDLQLAGLAHVGRPDGHARRNAEALEYRSEEHKSELQSRIRTTFAGFFFK